MQMLCSPTTRDSVFTGEIFLPLPLRSLVGLGRTMSGSNAAGDGSGVSRDVTVAKFLLVKVLTRGKRAGNLCG